MDARVQQVELGDLAGPSCLDPDIHPEDFAAFGESLILPSAREMVRHWLDRWHDGTPPGRAAILPEELGRLLSNTFLIEIEKDSGRAYYRLIGSELAAAMGYNSTGRYLDEIPLSFSAEMRARWHRRDRWTVREGRAVFTAWSMDHVGRGWRTITSLRLPLLEAGRVTHLLGYGTVE